MRLGLLLLLLGACVLTSGGSVDADTAAAAGRASLTRDAAGNIFISAPSPNGTVFVGGVDVLGQVAALEARLQALMPTPAPTSEPTTSPSAAPSAVPSAAPTSRPTTAAPTPVPSEPPTAPPTAAPTQLVSGQAAHSTSVVSYSPAAFSFSRGDNLADGGILEIYPNGARGDYFQTYTSSGPMWAVFSLGSSKKIGMIRIYSWREATPKDVVLSYSTSSSGPWTAFRTLVNPYITKGWNYHFFDRPTPISPTYVRFYVTTNHGDANFHTVAEVQFYEGCPVGSQGALVSETSGVAPPVFSCT